MGKDSADVIGDDSWDSRSEHADAVAVTMGKDSPDVVDETPKNTEVVESWDSEDDEDTMNRNSCEM